jgi:hypothetical protein
MLNFKDVTKSNVSRISALGAATLLLFFNDPEEI